MSTIVPNSKRMIFVAIAMKQNMLKPWLIIVTLRFVLIVKVICLVECFFDAINNSWKSDEGLFESSSGDETTFIEIGHDIPHPVNNGSDVDDPKREPVNEIINNKVWDDTLVNDIDEHFTENDKVPSIEVNPSTHSCSRTSAN